MLQAIQIHPFYVICRLNRIYHHLSICINAKRLRTSFKIQGSINVLCEGGLKRQTGVIQVYLDRQYNNKLFLESMFKCLSMKYMIYDKNNISHLKAFEVSVIFYNTP